MLHISSLSNVQARATDLWADMKGRLRGLRVYLVPVVVMLAIYVLGVSAILLANFNYVDDMVRAYAGTRGWQMSSRYLSNFISQFIHGSKFMSDVSPLPQLTACLILAVSSVIVLHLITGRTKFTVWEYAAVVPLGLSPYMLECLSFKFDSPYMAISVLGSVAPLLCFRRPRWLVLASALGTVVFCTTYQAASGILPMLTVVLALQQWLEGSDRRGVFCSIAAAAAGYLIGLLIFKFFIMHPPEGLSYASSDLLPLSQLVPGATHTLKAYFTKILTGLDKKWLVMIGLLGIGFIWAAVQRASGNKLLAAVLAAVAVVFLLPLSFGLYSVLVKVPTRPRTMYGFGAFIAFVAVSAVSVKRTLPAKFVCFALSWCFFVFAFTYGNALFAQKTYTEFRIEEAIDSIKATDSDLFSEEHQTYLQMKGNIGFAPVIRRTVDRFPVLKQLVPSTFGDYSWMTYYGFARYYDLPTIAWTGEPEPDLSKFHLPLLDDTVYHTAYGNENFLLIELK